MTSRIFVLLALLVGLPLAVYAQTFSGNGIFGCDGAAYGSVGSQGPTSSFVPVFDASAFDQQRILTYKECVLDGVNKAARTATIANLVKVTVDRATGADGNSPLFVTNFRQEELETRIEGFNEYMDSGALDGLLPEDRERVRAQLTEDFARSIQVTPALSCPELTPEQRRLFAEGEFNQAGGFDTWAKIQNNPACSSGGTYTIARNSLFLTISDNVREQRTMLDWANGFLTQFQTKTVTLGDGRTVTQKEVVTPGYLIAQQLSQVLGTGLRQTESADEIDSLISSAFTNLGTRMLTDINGLAGLAKSLGGQPSYVSQLATDAANRAREKMVGAAAAILNNSIATEQEYTRAQLAAQGILSSAQNTLYGWESTCYADMADQASIALTNRIKARVCPLSVTDPTVTCSAVITVAKTYATDVIVVTAPTQNTLTVTGYAQRADSRIEVSVSNSATSTTPVEVISGTTRAWEAKNIAIDTLGDGELTVTATEYFKDASGSAGPYQATVTKTDGVVTSLPTELPAVTVTVTSGAFSESETLARSREHAQDVVDANITINLSQAQTRVEEARQALDALAQLRNALAVASSVSGQREVLAVLDRLVAEHRIHSESDVREAQSINNDLEANVRQLLESTRTSWEGGWCDPDNWESHVQ